jgi:hypothetical protein
VTTSNARNSTNPVTYKADAVLCTLPLGVLKQARILSFIRSNTIFVMLLIQTLFDLIEGVKGFIYLKKVRLEIE